MDTLVSAVPPASHQGPPLFRSFCQLASLLAWLIFRVNTSSSTTTDIFRWTKSARRSRWTNSTTLAMPCAFLCSSLSPISPFVHELTHRGTGKAHRRDDQTHHRLQPVGLSACLLVLSPQVPRGDGRGRRKLNRQAMNALYRLYELERRMRVRAAWMGALAKWQAGSLLPNGQPNEHCARRVV